MKNNFLRCCCCCVHKKKGFFESMSRWIYVRFFHILFVSVTVEVGGEKRIENHVRRENEISLQLFSGFFFFLFLFEMSIKLLWYFSHSFTLNQKIVAWKLQLEHVTNDELISYFLPHFLSRKPSNLHISIICCEYVCTNEFVFLFPSLHWTASLPFRRPEKTISTRYRFNDITSK